MPKSHGLGLLIGCIALLSGGAAQASPIEYIFTGTCAASSCSLNGTDFTTFTVTEFADTANVHGTLTGPSVDVNSASFVSGALSATLTGINQVFDNTAAPATINFGQPSSLSAVGGSNSVFETYSLTTALAATTLTDSSFSTGLFDTSAGAGTLVFSDVTALSFQAVVTPLPAALPLFATGLGGLGLLGWRRKRKTQAV